MGFTLLSFAQGGRAEIVTLKTTKPYLCSFSIYGVAISNAEITGERADVIFLLENYSSFHIHSCSYILSSDWKKISEAEYLINHQQQEPPRSSSGLPPKSVFIYVASQQEFASVVESALATTSPSAQAAGGGAGGNAGGGGATPMPPGRAGDTGGTPSDHKSCEKGGEICISTDGTAELSVNCGPVKVTFSTEGAVSIGLKGEAGDFSVKLPGN